MNQQTIVDVLKSGQIVAWQVHEEGADTYVSIITWKGSLTLNLWQSLAGDGSFHNLDCKTLNDVGLSAFTLKQAYATGAAQKWLEEIQAEEEEELNSVPLGLDQEGEKFVDRRLFPGIDDNTPIADVEPPPTVRLRPQDWTEPNHPTD